MAQARTSEGSPHQGGDHWEKLVEQFDAAWQRGTPPRIDDYLRSVSAPTDPRRNESARRELLGLLIQIDLGYRWRLPGASKPLPAGPIPERPRIEDYVKHYAELGPLACPSLDLLGEEYWVRQRWGDRPAHAEYAARFPQHGEGLRQALLRRDAELAVEFAQENRAPARCEFLPHSALSPDQKSPGGKIVVPSVPEPIRSATTLVEALRQWQLLEAARLNELTGSEWQRHFSDPHTLARELVKRNWLTPYQVNQLLQGRGRDLVFGDHVLLERLGEGGTGQVFKARHQKMARVVALKMIRKELLSDADAVGRFYREIQLAGQLDHPNVVHAYDAGLVGEVPFLAMEYVEGTDLGKLVKQGGRLPVAQACEYIRQAALGLQHAHERGLVHRDIKPHNLIMSPRDGLIKVADLGLARLPRSVNQEATAVLTGQQRTGTLTPENAVLIGTADYLAPEQALDFHKADIRADIYSLGCTFYYLLTGQPPFATAMLAEKLLKHQQAEPRPLKEFRSDLPPGLSEVLGRMLAKRPADRYQTPGEVSQELAAYSNPGRLGAAKGGLIRAMRWRAWGRRRMLIGLVGGLALVGLASAGYWLFAPPPFQRLRRKLLDSRTDLKEAWPLYQSFTLRQPAPPETDQAVDLMWQYLIDLRARFPGTPQAIEAGIRMTQLPSPFDRLPEGRDPTYVDAVAQLGQLGGPRIQHVAISPDCKLVAGCRENGTIDLWEGSTGQKLFRLGEHKGTFAMAFSPKGRLLVTSSVDKTLKLWDLVEGKHRTWEVPVPANFDFSPDGKTLAATWANGDSPGVVLWDVVKETKKTLMNRSARLRPFFSPDGRTLACTESGLPTTLWNLNTGKERALAGLPNATSLAFAPDGQTLALGSDAGPIQLWGLAEGRQLKTLGKSGSDVVAFSADGKRLLVRTSAARDLQLLEVQSGTSLWQVRECIVGAPASDGRHLVIWWADASAYILRVPKKVLGP